MITQKKMSRAAVALALTCGAFMPQISSVSAARTIDDAALTLLEEATAVLGISITNADLREELSFELQYALETSIINSDTIVDLDIEIIPEELPDEELFEEDLDEEITDEDIVEDNPTTDSVDDSTPATTREQITEQLRIRLRDRFTLHLQNQVKYWTIVAPDWNQASLQTATQFNNCIAAASTEEDEDTCYFNELQQLQFYFAQELSNNFALRLSAANQVGVDVAGLVTQAMTRSREMIQETLQFMSEEELGALGTSTARLQEIERKLQGANSSPSVPTSTPNNSNAPGNTTNGNNP